MIDGRKLADTSQNSMAMESMSKKCLIITTHYRPLVGGAQTVYDAIATVRPEAFSVFTAAHDYVTGKEVLGWQAFDAAAPYKITRIAHMRPTLGPAGKGVFHRIRKFLEAEIIKAKVRGRLKKILREEEFDTLCIGALDSLGWLIEPLRKWSSATIVLYTHGEEISQKAYSASAETRRRAYLCGADGIVAVSSFTANMIANRYGVDPSRIEIVTNGVKLASVSTLTKQQIRQHFGLGEGPLVLSVGRLVQRKGFDMLLRAWPDVRTAVSGAELAIAGAGPLLEEFRAMAEAPEMQGSIHLLGFVPDELLPSLFADADLFAMPNRTMPDGDTEGFGLVFLEAAIAGTPSVAGNAGGAVDAVLDGKTGKLVDGNDIDAIATTVSALLTDDAERKRMGEVARDYALTQGWDAKADQLRAFFRRLKSRNND